MRTIPESKTAEAILFNHYLRTGQRLKGEAAQTFLETKALDAVYAREQKSVEVALFAHYLRTGERLSNDAAKRFVELKLNQRHYRENGQFARAGEGAIYGGGTARAGSGASQHHSTANAAEKPRTSTSSVARRSSGHHQGSVPLQVDTIARPARPQRSEVSDQTIENIRQTFGTAPAEKLDVSLLSWRPYLDLTSGDSAASFALRQVGAGTYQQWQANRHAVGRSVEFTEGRGSPRCNAMVFDSLH